MITYELCLLLRTMPKSQLKSTIKRTAQAIFDKGGIIRRIENMGTRDMPFKTSVHGVVYNKASYYLMEFNVSPQHVEDLGEEYGRDVDIVRKSIFKKQALSEVPACTLEEEMQPPSYRKDVQELISKAEQLKKPKFSYNSGLDYYPFQK